MLLKRIFSIVLLSFSLGSGAVGYCQGVPPVDDDELTAYLFAYFHGNGPGQEAVCYAVSRDALDWKALNGDRPVLNSAAVSSSGGVRDPHLLRREDGGFYMVVTDMVSSCGWDSNRAFVMLSSDNLIDWYSSVVNIQEKYEGQHDLKRVWAPQTIYDPSEGKYMVYWSMKHGEGPDVIYYAYANPAFTDIEGEPRVLFTPASGRSCIDGDIVCKDGRFYMFYKTEGHGDGIKLAVTDSLTSGRWTEYGDYKQQTDEAVEGSSVFPLIGQQKYILMYDVYKKGGYQFCESSDLMNFRVIDERVKMEFQPRHGSVVTITESELRRLFDRWGEPEGWQ